MAQSLVNVGTVANDGTGDPLRTAFQKVNANFVELYPGAAGSLIYGTSSTAVSALGIGASTTLLTSSGSAPQWSSIATVLGNLQGTGSSASDAGFRGIPINPQSGNYTCVLGDSGKFIFHASGDGSGDTYTIPANSSVAYPIGTVIGFINLDSNSVGIAITSDTMYLEGTGGTGTRTLGQYGKAFALKLASTTWIIGGSALS